MKLDGRRIIGVSSSFGGGKASDVQVLAATRNLRPEMALVGGNASEACRTYGKSSVLHVLRVSAWAKVRTPVVEAVVVPMVAVLTLAQTQDILMHEDHIAANGSDGIVGLPVGAALGAPLELGEALVIDRVNNRAKATGQRDDWELGHQAATFARLATGRLRGRWEACNSSSVAAPAATTQPHHSPGIRSRSAHRCGVFGARVRPCATMAWNSFETPKSVTIFWWVLMGAENEHVLC
jgi:hypothetical protein